MVMEYLGGQVDMGGNAPKVKIAQQKAEGQWMNDQIVVLPVALQEVYSIDWDYATGYARRAYTNLNR